MTAKLLAKQFEGVYEVPEAARYLHADIRIPDASYRVTSTHLIRWIRFGLADRSLAHTPGRGLLISFEDLISMRVIAFLRALDYSFPKIRKAESLLRTITGHSRPFATEQIWAEKEGSLDIFAEIASVLLSASRGGQLPFIELVKERLINPHGLTFDQRGIASSWTPREGILLHPRIQFGRPCIAGTRIPTSDVAGMVNSGDSVEYLARCYNVPSKSIDDALSWERELAAKSSPTAVLCAR
jgi:uncharacterized protein (DUF433 family)